MNIRQPRRDSEIARALKVLDDQQVFTLSPRRKFRLKSQVIRNSFDKSFNETQKDIDASQLTSQKIITVRKIKCQQQSKHQLAGLIRLYPSVHSKVENQEGKKKDRLQIYRKMLQPKILKTRMFSPCSTRKRSYSVDETPILPPLLMTFGKKA